ncbi:hypothetical protein ACFQ88_22580 [Paenibacillus sp. NPDC056579]|uniref:hypothetical protein n=1 Tax=unclassified Paenibacillus TaxID=185978 RepID=UPI001EF8EAE7|nr:hypothetical protein [Paenibacillus sp. H1-7]ULL14769.1 hypothetical protein DVH26_10100 [Paenibacillus sp. H1-7]
MSESLLSLLEQMKTARTELNQVTSLAINVRKLAIQLENEVALATDAADDATQYLTHVSDNPSLLQVAEIIRNEAVQKLIKTSQLAEESLNRADEADAAVAKAFIIVKEAAEKLSIALKNATTKEMDM